MRLIDADELIELYEMREELKNYEKLLSVPIPVIQQNIKDMPTIEAEPVKRGRWKDADDGDGAVCSICGEDFCHLYLETDRFNYCPNCGAKMEVDDG